MRHITDIMDTSLLSQHLKEGLVVQQHHPELPLNIYNYSHRCQFSRAWDEVTLLTRGLVVADDGEIIIQALPKFFNLQEHLAFPDELGTIPDEPFTVFEKVDGSLFLTRNHPEYGLITASRGSFTSEQAIKGRELLTKNTDIDKLSPDMAYIFEVIYPENRIVVNYKGIEELVLLETRDMANLREFDTTATILWADHLGFRTPTFFKHIDDLHKADSHISDNEEGYVVKFASGFRLKIKGEEYKRLHKVMTNTNARHIWEWLRDGRDLDTLIANVPDEFYQWVVDLVDELQTKYDTLDTKNRIAAYDSLAELTGLAWRAETLLNNALKIAETRKSWDSILKEKIRNVETYIKDTSNIHAVSNAMLLFNKAKKADKKQRIFEELNDLLLYPERLGEVFGHLIQIEEIQAKANNEIQELREPHLEQIPPLDSIHEALSTKDCDVKIATEMITGDMYQDHIFKMIQPLSEKPFKEDDT